MHNMMQQVDAKGGNALQASNAAAAESEETPPFAGDCEDLLCGADSTSGARGT